MNLRTIFSRIIYALSILITCAGCLLLLFVGLKIFLFDTYPVNTGSMLPTIHPGSRIVVNKLIFGARLYKSLDFLNGGELHTLRLKGYRGVKYNDVVVFNRTSPLAFDIGHVYVKRCIGLPGDTIWIRDGQYHNSSVKDGVIFQYHAFNDSRFTDTSFLESYPYHKELAWTIRNFGPLYLPRKGDRINISSTDAWLYRRMVAFENPSDVRFTPDTIFMNGIPIQTYTFKESYYFMAGDNFPSSSDSRYFGPIPETFIVGVVPLKINAKRRWERL